MALPVRLLRACPAAALLLALAVVPASADHCAPDGSDCPPDPPQSVQVNPHPAVTEGETAPVSEPSPLTPLRFQPPAPSGVSVPSPRWVTPVPLPSGGGSVPSFPRLSVRLRYQDPSDVSCGVQALGMALEALGGAAPASSALLAYLQGQGMLYPFGTGVEELAAAAHAFGYTGSLPFHGWGLSDLAAELASGRPVVVALGANGAGVPGHFVTVTGLSADGRWVSVADPLVGERVLSVRTFVALWGLQGYSGVAVRAASAAAGDSRPDVTPWVMALAGLMAALTSRGVLTTRRKGVGAGLLAGGGGSSSAFPPYPAPPGYRWVLGSEPVYAWRRVQIGTRLERQPITRRVWKQVGWKPKQVPVYRTVTVQQGWTYYTVRVPVYRTVRYVRYYRRVPKFYKGMFVGFQSVPVYGWRRVYAGTRPELRRKPRWVTYKVFDHWKTVQEPVYGWVEEVVGYRAVSVPVYGLRQVQVGTRPKWRLQKVSGTPTPPGWQPTPQPTPSPARPPTPAPSATPVPAGAVSLWPALSGGQATRLVGYGAAAAEDAYDIWIARALRFRGLASGHVSVSAPGLTPGTRLAFRQGWGYAGTRYLPGTLASRTGRVLLREASGPFGLGVPLVTSVAANYLDWREGRFANANQFAASAMVDFAQAGLTGLAGAGVAAVVVAGAAAAFGITVPLAVALAVAVIAGAILEAGMSHFVDTQRLKDRVAEGLGAWPGIFHNAGVIGQVATQRAGQWIGRQVQVASQQVGNLWQSVIGGSG